MLVIFGFVLALRQAAQVAYADFTFGEPVNLGPVVNSSSLDIMCCITGDALEMYIFSNRPGGQGSWDLWVATRPTTDADWGPWQNLGPTVNTPSQEGSACISADGLSLYFPSDRPGGYGQLDIWVARRETKADKWGIPVNLGPTVNSGVAGYPDISADGLSLYFGSDRAGGLGGTDLWVTTRETTDDNWGPPANLGPTVNSTSRDADPSISSDGLVLFFDSERPGGYGPENLYMTRRATRNDPWGKPVNLGPPVDTSAGNGSSNVSADCRTLYFTSNRPGGYGSYDIWQAPIIPIVDFNGDRIVDLKDFSRLAQYWGQNEPSVDIAPMPWGDGRVDIQDVAVFAEHWLEGAAPIALWKLDETEGWIAHDSAGPRDGFVMAGNPLWQPTGGQIDGALHLDGVDDYVSTPFILDPAAGAFSVFAWIKGGSPGQVIISQTDGTGTGATWLGTGPSDGTLMSALVSSGRLAGPLVSNAVITDGQWHHIGLVWDGSYRTLYVDDGEAAKDAQPQSQPISANGGLYIGTGKGREPGSFWSGLIDDVRIYDRAITP
jgi:hypothetical protein